MDLIILECWSTFYIWKGTAGKCLLGMEIARPSGASSRGHQAQGGQLGQSCLSPISHVTTQQAWILPQGPLTQWSSLIFVSLKTNINGSLVNCTLELLSLLWASFLSTHPSYSATRAIYLKHKSDHVTSLLKNHQCLLTAQRIMS